MDYFDRYQKWRRHKDMDPELKKELKSIEGMDEKIKDRFEKELSFGTGGIRGPMGAGPARINIFMIRKATLGLAKYLHREKKSEKRLSVVIAYDTRKNSDRFAKEAAGVLAEEGIEVWLFPQPAPTPLLSFAVRTLRADAGVVITASHNPPADNGYKVYNADGGQITDHFAQEITKQIGEIEDELSIQAADLAAAEGKGLLRWVDKSVEKEYIEKVCDLGFREQWLQTGLLPVSIVYTALHGTGARYMPRIFNRIGVKDLFLVSEQMIMDPACPTVKYPNPEDWEVYAMAIELGLDKKADLLLAMDLDADRLGVAVKDQSDQFVPLSGNQLGCLMLYYILSQHKKGRTLPSNGIMIQTVVTTEMGKKIAESFGVEVIETLTGFKYIGELIKSRVDHRLSTFLFGFEESYGFLAGDFVRDKDGFQGALIAAEMAAFYRTKNMSLIEALEELYQEYGYFREELINIDLQSGEMDKVEKIMDHFRCSGPRKLVDSPVIKVIDYASQKELNTRTKKSKSTNLPVSNSMKYISEDGSWFCVRPSGTEPKIKIYLGVKGDTKTLSEKKKEALKTEIKEEMANKF